MKKVILILITGALLIGCNNSSDMTRNIPVANNYLYIEIHNLGKGKVASEAIAQVHKKDLMVQDKNHVSFVNYWADEKNGYVYGPSESRGRKPLAPMQTKTQGLVPHTIK